MQRRGDFEHSVAAAAGSLSIMLGGITLAMGVAFVVSSVYAVYSESRTDPLDEFNVLNRVALLAFLEGLLLVWPVGLLATALGVFAVARRVSMRAGMLGIGLSIIGFTLVLAIFCLIFL